MLAASLTQSLLQAPYYIQSGSSVPVTLVARDAAGTLGNNRWRDGCFWSGLRNRPSTFGGVTDNNNGTYSALFTGTTAGLNSVTATINGQALTSPACAFQILFDVLPGPISLDRSTLTVSSASVSVGMRDFHRLDGDRCRRQPGTPQYSFWLHRCGRHRQRRIQLALLLIFTTALIRPHSPVRRRAPSPFRLLWTVSQSLQPKQ